MRILIMKLGKTQTGKRSHEPSKRRDIVLTESGNSSDVAFSLLRLSSLVPEDLQDMNLFFNGFEKKIEIEDADDSTGHTAVRMYLPLEALTLHLTIPMRHIFLDRLRDLAAAVTGIKENLRVIPRYGTLVPYAVNKLSRMAKLAPQLFSYRGENLMSGQSLKTVASLIEAVRSSDKPFRTSIEITQLFAMITELKRSQREDLLNLFPQLRWLSKAWMSAEALQDDVCLNEAEVIDDLLRQVFVDRINLRTENKPNVHRRTK